MTARATSRGRNTTDAADPVRILACHTIPYGWSEPDALTAALKVGIKKGKHRRRGWVNVWGVPATYRPISPLSVSVAELLREVRRDRSDRMCLLTSSATGGAAAPNPTNAGGIEGHALLVVASADALRAKIQPLLAAGFTIDGISIPPLVMCSVARLHSTRPIVAPTAVVAIGPRMMALTVVHGARVLLAREILWGYEQIGTRILPRGRFETRLVIELRRSLGFCKRNAGVDVQQIVICGEVPEIKGLAASLAATLGCSVQAVQSLQRDGTLPAVSDSARVDATRLVPAWAVAVDNSPPLNLVVPKFVEGRRVARYVKSLAAGATAAMIIGGATYGYFDRAARLSATRALALEQQITKLGPRIREVERVRRQALLTTARRDTLEALDSQGPRLARVLEVLAQASPDDVQLRRLTLTASGPSWRASLSGTAVFGDPARAKASVDELLQALDRSPYIGALSATTSLRETAQSLDSSGPTSTTSAQAQILATSGEDNKNDFHVTFEVRR